MLPLFLPNVNGSEIVIIALVVLVLFGGRKIPEFMRGLGKGVKSFKDGVNNIKEDLDDTSKPKDRSDEPADSREDRDERRRDS